jgi:hypothetical protein
MPPLSWNEIASRAVTFSTRWAGEPWEKGESQSFWHSAGIVYDTFPWQENVTDTQRAQIETVAQGVLDARSLYPDSSLADLYDPLAIPKELVDAHHKLDRAVDRHSRAHRRIRMGATPG